MLTTLLFGLTLAASADDSVRLVVLTDGQSLRGVVDKRDDGDVIVTLADGSQLPIPAALIARIDDAPTESTAGPSDPNRSRYFYGPSGFSLGQGKGYVAQRALVLSSVGVGIVDGWDLEVGAVLPTLFFPDARIGFVGTKVSGQVADKVRLMGGAQAVLVPDALPVALGFVGATFGTEDRHFSITTGPGLGFNEERPAVTETAQDGTEQVIEPAQSRGVDLGVWITSFSAVHRVSPRVAVVTENWVMVLPDGGPWDPLPLFILPSGGVRLMGPRYATDLGLVPLIIAESDVPLVPLPWVSFDWTW